MANPKNSGTYTGRVTRLHFICDKTNEPFQLRFVIKVERVDISKSGKKLYDFLPMRISGATTVDGHRLSSILRNNL